MIWNALYHSAHAKVSSVQQVIRNVKNTRGGWLYLRGKVTLGPPSVGAYVQSAAVCIENRQSPECCCCCCCYRFLGVFHSFLHSSLFYTCSLDSCDTVNCITALKPRGQFSFVVFISDSLANIWSASNLVNLIHISVRCTIQSTPSLPGVHIHPYI